MILDNFKLNRGFQSNYLDDYVEAAYIRMPTSNCWVPYVRVWDLSGADLSEIKV